MQDLITAVEPRFLKRTKTTNIKRLQSMGRMRWETEKVNTICVGKVNPLLAEVRPMSVEDKQDGFSGVVSSFGMRYETLFEPLEPYLIVGPAIFRGCNPEDRLTRCQ